MSLGFGRFSNSVWDCEGGVWRLHLTHWPTNTLSLIGGEGKKVKAEICLSSLFSLSSDVDIKAGIKWGIKKHYLLVPHIRGWIGTSDTQAQVSKIRFSVINISSRTNLCGHPRPPRKIPFVLSFVFFHNMACYCFELVAYTGKYERYVPWIGYLITGCPQKTHQLNKQKWPTWQACQHSKVVQRGPKGSKRVQNGQPRCFWPFGTLLGPSGPFYKDYFKRKMIFCSKTPPPHSTLSLWGNKLIFVWNGLKVSRWNQRVPNCQKRLDLPAKIEPKYA